MGTISGRVVLEDQASLPSPDHSGVEVAVEGHPEFFAKTGVDGSYTISDVPPGLYQLVFSKKGYVTRKEVVEVKGGKVIVPDVRMPLGGVISRKTIYEGEKDHSGITVVVLGTDLSAITGSDGLYRFDGVEPGKETRVQDIVLTVLEIYGEVKLETIMNWVKPEVNEFTIKADGSAEPPGIQPNSFIQGKWHPELRNNPIFNVDYPATGKFIIRARSVATGRSCACCLDRWG